MARLSGWTRAIKIDIDYTGGIGASVTYFPVTIILNSTNGDTTKVFDEIGANKQKIAITKADGITELYAEVELWDTVTRTGVIHVSKSDWVINANTCVYLYFDSAHADNTTYIGIVAGASPATLVWDDNFVMVQHMNDATTSTITDSTQYGNNGTKTGANEPIEAAGQIGKAQSFDGVNDYIESASVVPTPSAFTATILFKRLGNSGGASDSNYHLLFNNLNGANNRGRLIVTRNGDTVSGLIKVNATNYSFNKSITPDIWHHLGLMWDGSYLYSIVDGVLTQEVAASGTLDSGANKLLMGRFDATTYIANCLMDEVYISNVARSAAWIKAEYNAGNGTLLTYGIAETFDPGYIRTSTVIKVTETGKASHYNSLMAELKAALAVIGTHNVSSVLTYNGDGLVNTVTITDNSPVGDTGFDISGIGTWSYDGSDKITSFIYVFSAAEMNVTYTATYGYTGLNITTSTEVMS